MNKIAPISLKMIKLLIKRIKRLLVPLQIAPLMNISYKHNTYPQSIYLQGRNRFLFQMKTVEFAFEIN